MIIKKIRLHNIRSHMSTEIDFNKGITVLAGRTGCGKSSILMAIEYALFGSSGISNSQILRRNKTSGYVELFFEENGKEYVVKRALKRTKNSIVVDSNNTFIKSEGRNLTLEGRASDINAKIIEILNYPNDIKPNELFEITSYTKQDEIRKIIELKAEERQKYIDKILQFSKYRETYDNMKDLLSYFESELKSKKAMVEFSSGIEEDYERVKEEIDKLKKELQNIEIRLLEVTEEYKKISSEKRKILEERKNAIELKAEFEKLKGKIESGEKQSENLNESLNRLKEKKKEIEKELEKYKEITNLEKLQNELIKIKSEIDFKEKEIEKNKKELEKVLKIGGGACPFCKQKIDRTHLEKLHSEVEELERKNGEKIKELKKNLEEIETKIEKAKKKEKLELQLKSTTSEIQEKESFVKELDKDLEELKHKIGNIKIDERKLKEVERKFEEISNLEMKVNSQLVSLRKASEIYKNNLLQKENEMAEKKRKIEEIKNLKEEIRKIEDLLSLLKRLRADIRNIREIVRRNFLEDFRQEFQRKFEEIRKYEEEYTVDIESDYAPVAYTMSGDKVPISNLSGGEKTSVALAYRLALSDLASQISSIKQTQLLILDEPTTGLDKDDIKALPEALSNITSIPQIVIVTHEEELKNAAHYRYDIIKKDGVSQIISS